MKNKVVIFIYAALLIAVFAMLFFAPEVIPQKWDHALGVIAIVLGCAAIYNSYRIRKKQRE